MGTLAWFFGFLGGLCLVMGITTVLAIIPLMHPGFTATFWMMLSALLLLISIAFAIGRGGGE